MKRILSLLLTVILVFLFSTAVSADFAPERRPDGETLYIEPDENVIKDNIAADTENFEDDLYDDEIKEITFDRVFYIERFFKPAVFTVILGIILLCITELIGIIRKSFKIQVK